MKKIGKIIFLFVMCIFVMNSSYTAEDAKYEIGTALKSSSSDFSGYKVYIDDKEFRFVTEVYDSYIKGKTEITETKLKEAIIESNKKLIRNVIDSLNKDLNGATYKKGKDTLPLVCDAEIKIVYSQSARGYTANQYEEIDYLEYKFFKLQNLDWKINGIINKFEKINIDINEETKHNFAATDKITYASYYDSKVSSDSINYYTDMYEKYVKKFETQISTCNSNIDKFNAVSQAYINADTDTNTNTNTGGLDVGAKYGDDWWESAFWFLKGGKDSGLNIGELTGLKDLQGLVFDIGNIIFILVTAFLGVKYIWGGVESKFSVKNSLVTLVVAAIVFYGWNAVTTILNVEDLLTEQSAGGYQNFAVTIYNTIMYIINVAAIGGIIYIGIKYLMAGADGKAEMKLKFIPVIMGIIMVYGALNVINFILDIVYTM